jgi:hypothetical protein
MQGGFCGSADVVPRRWVLFICVNNKTTAAFFGRQCSSFTIVEVSSTWLDSLVKTLSTSIVLDRQQRQHASRSL